MSTCVFCVLTARLKADISEIILSVETPDTSAGGGGGGVSAVSPLSESEIKRLIPSVVQTSQVERDTARASVFAHACVLGCGSVTAPHTTALPPLLHNRYV